VDLTSASLIRRSSAGLVEFPMSDTSVAGRYLTDTRMANGYEQPANWAWIVVLVAMALPVFGGLYYALLDFLLFG
jgi:hypothetical protein